MDKIIMLGTGNGGTMNLYNTCFLINHNNQNFLVDTGGSIEILRRLSQKNVDIENLHHIFISHSHTDHILGLIWMFKKFSVLAMHNKIKEKLNIYSNDDVNKAIIAIINSVFPSKLLDLIFDNVHFHILKDHEVVNINGIDYTFFDVKEKSVKLYGFKCTINNKIITFVGDSTLNNEIKDIVKDSDYAMHEAFCLDSEEDIFHAYEKKHSTVKYACEVMNGLNVKNLILFHTEESHGKARKALYEEEGNKYFEGRVIVPDDMEEINL